MRTPWAFLHHWLFEQPDEDRDHRRDTVAGLRTLAKLIESGKAPVPTHGLTIWHSIKHYGEDYSPRPDADVKADFDSARRAIGGRWEKKPSGESWTLERELGGAVVYKLSCKREAVCEKRVVGTRQVERYAPSQLREVVTEEIVEWDCP